MSLGSLVGPGPSVATVGGLLDEANLVLLVGTRANQNGDGQLAAHSTTAKIVHIDIDPCEIGRTYEPLRLVGSAAETLRALHKTLQGQSLSLPPAGQVGLEARIAVA
ncbi:hypothetical protein [Mesorhizobium sp. M0772]|uniref:hypothetical protein n=1 Tax=Mesorhizobium sp. M0772 TaxID=2956998 RepID=UPI003339D91A